MNSYPISVDSPRTLHVDVAAGRMPGAGYGNPLELTRQQMLQQRLQAAWFNLDTSLGSDEEEDVDVTASKSPRSGMEFASHLGHGAIDGALNTTAHIGHGVGDIALTLFNDGQLPGGESNFVPPLSATTSQFAGNLALQAA